MPDSPQMQSPSLTLESVIERYDQRPDTCTIFRADVPPDRRPATAITAAEGSYVDLVMCR